MDEVTNESALPMPEFGTPRENEERRDGGCAIIFNPETKLFAVGNRNLPGKSALFLFGGGQDTGETIREAVIREVKEESGLYDFSSFTPIARARAHYYNGAKHVNRVADATCFLAVCKSITAVPQQLEAHEEFSVVWVSAPEILASWDKDPASHDYDHWKYFLETAIEQLRERGL